MPATIENERVGDRQKVSLSERVIPVPLILSACAVAISLTALFWAIYRDPLRSRLSEYDFSSSKASLVSNIKLDVNNDIGSRLAMQRLLGQRAIEEKLRTIAVHKESEWRGNKILFISYEENGLKKHAISSFTKDAETGFWIHSYASSYSVGKEDKALSTMIETWEQKGRFE